jgi:nitrite reductase/ring-hydroxylating ferredoxin subunit
VIGRLLNRIVDGQAAWARPLGDFNHRWLSALFRPMRPVKDLLNGTWLGHPFHSASTDLPIGVLLVSVVLDLVGQPAAADIALVIAILFMLASAVSGAADYTDTDGKARERATVHATLMVSALFVLLISLVLRASPGADRTLPTVLSIIGLLVVTAGAFVGGDVVYVFGNMVSRHAFRGAGGKWIALEVDGGVEADQIPELTLTKAKLGINTLVLVRQGTTVHALHEQCAHAGGPLSGGTIVDGCLECPWHGSRFRLTDGRLCRGPTVYDQPVFEVRRGENRWEGRRIS